MSKALVINGVDFTINRIDQVELDVIHAEGITISMDSIDCDTIGQSYNLTVSVIPNNAEDPIVWTTSNANVATVVNGSVTVVGVGTCTIKATAGNVFATCTVTAQVYLTGYNTYKKTIVEASSSSNRITACDTTLGTSYTSYKRYLMCCVPEMPFNHLMAHYLFTKLVDGKYVLITDSADLSQGPLWVFTQIGYPTPIPLAPNTTKVRFICPDNLHGAYPLFFKKDVEAYPESGTTEGRAHFSPWRSYTNPISSYNWTYAVSHDVDVPDNCDSLIVTFGTDTNNGGTMIYDMTDEQLEGFKILCM